MNPLTFAEDVEQRRRLLPMALSISSPTGMVSNSVQPSQALPMALARLKKVNKDLDALESQNIDTSALQAFARQQGEQGESAMLGALAAQYAGENFQPMQAQFLKRAMAAQEPMRIGQGMLTPDGQYLKDPFAARDTRRAALERQSGQIASEIDRIERADRDRADRQLRDAIDQQRDKRDYNLRVDMFNLRRDQANKRGEDITFTQSGFTPDGKQLVTNKTGINFVLEIGPQGQPIYTPYTGAAIPKTTFDKNVVAVQEALASANRADAIIKQVDANPEAFGIIASAVSTLPSFVQGRVGAIVLDENTMKLRSDVLRAAAMEISSLYGAALSLGEQARANTFIPNQNDPPEVVIQKLRAARDWAKSTAQQYGGGVMNAAQTRSSGQPASASGQPVPPSGGSGGKKVIDFNSLPSN